MKFLIFSVASLFALAQAQVPYGYIALRMCFPGGFPENAPLPPLGSCYKEGFPQSISASNGPCVIPVLKNGYALPPCTGNHYRLASYSTTQG